MSGVVLWENQKTGIYVTWEKNVGIVLGSYESITPPIFQVTASYDRRKVYASEEQAVLAASKLSEKIAKHLKLDNYDNKTAGRYTQYSAFEHAKYKEGVYQLFDLHRLERREKDIWSYDSAPFNLVVEMKDHGGFVCKVSENEKEFAQFMTFDESHVVALALATRNTAYAYKNAIEPEDASWGFQSKDHGVLVFNPFADVHECKWQFESENSLMLKHPESNYGKDYMDWIKTVASQEFQYADEQRNTSHP